MKNKKRNIMTQQQKMDKKVIIDFFRLYPENLWNIISVDELYLQKSYSTGYLSSGKPGYTFVKKQNVFYTPNSFCLRYCQDKTSKYSGKLVTRKTYSHLSSLECLYTDIDFKNNKDKNVTFENFIEKLPSILKQAMLPEPTMIVCSGHGYHLLWKIKSLRIRFGWKDIVRTDILSAWYGMQLYIHKKMARYGADCKVALDPTRFLRYPGTINVKSGQDPVECHYVSFCGQIYDLYALREYTKAPMMRITQTLIDKYGYEKKVNQAFDETICSDNSLHFVSGKDYILPEMPEILRYPSKIAYLNESKSEYIFAPILPADKEMLSGFYKELIMPSPRVSDGIRKDKRCKPLQRSSHITLTTLTEEMKQFQGLNGNNLLYLKKNPNSKREVLQLFHARALDITDLLHLRDTVCAEGYREVSFFILSYYLCVIHNSPMDALQECVNINNSLVYGLEWTELEHAVKSGIGYWTRETGMIWTNEMLCSWLGVTQEEQEHMRQIMSANEVNRRKDLRQKRVQEKRKRIRALGRQSNEMLLLDRIRDCLKDGMEVDEICRLCDISRATFYRKMKSLQISKRPVPKRDLEGIRSAKKEMTSIPDRILHCIEYENYGNTALIHEWISEYQSMCQEVNEMSRYYERMWSPPA